MRSGAGDPHLVDVELVEGDLPLGADVGVPGPAVAVPGRDRRHARAWAAVAILASVTLVVAVVNRAEERRDENRLAALAELPGFLDPLTEPLAEAWRTGAGQPVARTDTVVVARDAAGALRGLDLVTGAATWARPGADGEACEPVVRPAGRDVEAVPLVARLACLPQPRLGVPGAEAVTMLDATSGDVVWTRAIGHALFADVADGVVVLTAAESDGAVSVRAWEVATGEDRWSFRSAQGLLARLEAAGGGRYDLGEGRVSIGNRDDGFTLDLATGRRVWAPRTGPVLDGVALPSGDRVEWAYDRFGRPTEVQVLARDGEVRFGAAGVPWLAPVSDGSTDDVLVVRRTADQHLLGLDAGSGRVLWDLPNVPWLRPSVHVGGVAVGLGPSTAVVLDLGTGLRLWDGRVARLAEPWEALTDGRVVLLPEEGAAGGLWLSARRLRTGDLAWQVSLPAGVERVVPAGGRTVLAVTATGFAALR